VDQSKLTYRAEIDGLRALAVISVILYHAKFVFFGRDWFKGGYLGVDIFFVISGYLITRIILSELFEKGSFSFLNFYERRARRILPMLLVISFVSILIGCLLLEPTDFVELAQSIIASLIFSSNIFFFVNTTEYGADSSLLKPFLHTWSLAVEEQFYLLFPIIAIISFRFFRKQFLLILISGALLSLMLSEGTQGVNPDLNFYSPFTRFWELALGAILAHRELARPSKGGFGYHGAVTLTGLLLVILPILLFNEKTPHPGFLTLIPVIGVALIIQGSSREHLVSRILSSPALASIGLISYSAYLWHFPLMAFWRSVDTEVNNSIAIKFIWIFLIFLFSIVSYRYIEKPFRNRQLINSRSFIFITGVSATLVLALCTLIWVNHGFVNRIPDKIRRESYDDRFANNEMFNRCHKIKSSDVKVSTNFCHLGEGRKKVYLIGDSHMAAISFKLLDELRKRDGQLILMTRGNALFGRRKKLDALRLQELDKVADSVVIFGGYAHRQSSSFFEGKEREYKALFAKLIKNRNKIVLIYPIPSTSVGRRAFLFEHKFLGGLHQKSSSLSDFRNISKSAYEFYDRLGGTEILRIYPEKFLCDSSRCYGVKDQEILISDIDHPSSVTAKWIVDKVFDGLVGKYPVTH
jgi:peptidoglycan/LPS O-acetylase OafA/YrhL